MVGTILDHYELIALIGSGGMGEVYRARDTRLRRDVAIKILPERLASQPDLLHRFQREARAVAALSHPNVCAIYDFGLESGTHYAVMELLEGETLRARLSRGPLAWREATDIVAGVADGLAAAHAKGIAHRDLKPENLFLTADGCVKILDFGLARVTPTGAGDPEALEATVAETTRAGIVLGTYPYMSPEQARGDLVGPASDVFSLGCVLYEAITGQRAFARNTPAETLAAVL
jgi:serine/threonine protein kinase